MEPFDRTRGREEPPAIPGPLEYRGSHARSGSGARTPKAHRICDGVTAGLILAMVFLAMVGAVQAFGDEMTNMFNDVSSQSVSAMGGAV